MTGKILYTKTMLKKINIDYLLRGCGCKKGCTTSRCKKAFCEPGCVCSKCKNVPVQTEQNETDSESECSSTTDSDVSCDDIV